MEEMKDENKQNPEEEIISVLYIKCGKCNVVSMESNWTQDEESIMVCPVCGALNVAANELERMLLEQQSDNAGQEESMGAPFVAWIEIIAPFTKQELDSLDEIKKHKSDLEKLEKKLAPKIKDFLVANKIVDFDFQGHKMFITFQDRGTLDEDKLVALIKEVLDPQEIDMLGALKQISNPAVMPQLIADGKITMEQLSSCKIQNIIPVFNLNPKPKKEKAEVNPFAGGML